MNKREFYDLLEKVPKAELHLHEEAAITNGTIRKLYRERFGRGISKAELGGLFSYSDLPGFLDSFIRIQKLFVSVDSLSYLFGDLRRYLLRNNIVYCETFFSPTTHLRKGFDFSAMIDQLSAGIRQLREDDGIIVKILIDVSRSFGEENAMHNLDLTLREVKERGNTDIIGIGLGGDEAKGPARDFERVFRKAREAGLHVVAHAGETCPSESIRDAVEILGAERIGHGTTAVYDSALVRELAAKKIPLEVCPTSNIFTRKYITSMSEHPVKKLYDEGVFITLSTDDPTFFKVSLIDEYWNLYRKLKFSLNDILRIVLNGFEGSFAPQPEKDAYCRRASDAWREWFASHPGAGD